MYTHSPTTLRCGPHSLPRLGTCRRWTCKSASHGESCQERSLWAIARTETAQHSSASSPSDSLPPTGVFGFSARPSWPRAAADTGMGVLGVATAAPPRPCARPREPFLRPELSGVFTTPTKNAAGTHFHHHNARQSSAPVHRECNQATTASTTP